MADETKGISVTRAEPGRGKIASPNPWGAATLEWTHTQCRETAHTTS